MNGPGSMHSKLQLLKYANYLRIVVPSANLVPYDWGESGHMENVSDEIPHTFFMMFLDDPTLCSCDGREHGWGARFRMADLSKDKLAKRIC